MISADLTGKTILVTGGASGIGLASARALCEMGFGVALMGRRAQPIAEAVADLRSSFPDVAVTGCPADVADREQVEATVEAVAAAHGRIDGLVDSAAVGVVQPILESSGEDWTTTFASGVLGSALCCAAVARRMRPRGSGRIVLISSIVSTFVDPGVAAHCADKAALSSLTRSLAVELAPYGIAANAVAPGWVRTAAAESYMPEGSEWMKAINPLGRVGEPEEIAGVVRWLVAEAPSFLTGVTIPVDGGATARGPF
jgi:NAD(P)-dependent dehydrogenase (short-subunit alcohol dehydrogenase family)